MLRLDRPLLINDEDDVEMFVLLRASHDGSSHVEASVLPVHRATGAALVTDIPGAPMRWVMRHTGDVQQKFADAVATMRMVEEWALEFRSMTSRLLAAPLDEAQFDAFARHMLPTPRYASERSAKTWADRRRHLTRLYAEEHGLYGSGTCWAAFTAWCAYTDFHAAARGGDPQAARDARVVSGAKDGDKARAWTYLVKVAALA